MGKFEKMLRKHDWSFQYSDDNRYWRAGRESLAKLQKEHARLNCPFHLGDNLCGGLYAWVCDFVVEKFYELEDGKWYRTGCKYGPKVIAPLRRKDLLTQAEFDAITKWMEENDPEE